MVAINIIEYRREYLIPKTANQPSTGFSSVLNAVLKFFNYIFKLILRAYLVTIRTLWHCYSRVRERPLVSILLYSVTTFFGAYLYALYGRYCGDAEIGWWMDVLACCLVRPDEIRFSSWPVGWYPELKDRLRCESLYCETGVNDRSDYQSLFCQTGSESVSIALRCRLFAAAAYRIWIDPTYTLFTTYFDPLVPSYLKERGWLSLPLEGDKTMSTWDFFNGLFPQTTYFFTDLFAGLMEVCGPSLALTLTILYGIVVIFVAVIYFHSTAAIGSVKWRRGIQNGSGFTLLVLLSWGVWFTGLDIGENVMLLILWRIYVRTLHQAYGPVFGWYVLYLFTSVALITFDSESDPHVKWFPELRRDPAEADWILTNLTNLILRKPVKFETAPSQLSEELEKLLLPDDATWAQIYYKTLLYFIGKILNGPICSIQAGLKYLINVESSHVYQPVNEVLHFLCSLECPTPLFWILTLLLVRTLDGLGVWKVEPQDAPHLSLRKRLRNHSKRKRDRRHLLSDSRKFIKKIPPVYFFILLFYFVGWGYQIPMLWLGYWSLCYFVERRHLLKHPKINFYLLYSLTFHFFYICIVCDPRLNWVAFICSIEFYNTGIITLVNEDWPSLVDQSLKARVDGEMEKGPLPMWLRRQLIARALIYMFLLPVTFWGEFFTPNIVWLTCTVCDDATWQSLVMGVSFFYYLNTVSIWIMGWVGYSTFFILLFLFIAWFLWRVMRFSPHHRRGRNWTILYFIFLLLCILLFHIVHSLSLLLGWAYWALLLTDVVLVLGFAWYLV